jgi:hypothetical protein
LNKNANFSNILAKIFLKNVTSITGHANLQYYINLHTSFLQDSLLDKLEEVKPEAARSPDEEVKIELVPFLLDIGSRFLTEGTTFYLRWS